MCCPFLLHVDIPGQIYPVGLILPDISVWICLARYVVSVGSLIRCLTWPFARALGDVWRSGLTEFSGLAPPPRKCKISFAFVLISALFGLVLISALLSFSIDLSVVFV